VVIQGRDVWVRLTTDTDAEARKVGAVLQNPEILRRSNKALLDTIRDLIYDVAVEVHDDRRPH
jgi:hypothetical protein